MAEDGGGDGNDDVDGVIESTDLMQCPSRAKCHSDASSTSALTWTLWILGATALLGVILVILRRRVATVIHPQRTVWWQPRVPLLIPNVPRDMVTNKQMALRAGDIIYTGMIRGPMGTFDAGAPRTSNQWQTLLGRRMSRWTDSSWLLQFLMDRNDAWTHVCILVPANTAQPTRVDTDLPAGPYPHLMVLEMGSTGIALFSIPYLIRHIPSDYQAIAVPLVDSVYDAPYGPHARGPDRIPACAWADAIHSAMRTSPKYAGQIIGNMVRRATFGTYADAINDSKLLLSTSSTTCNADPHHYHPSSSNHDPDSLRAPTNTLPTKPVSIGSAPTTALTRYLSSLYRERHLTCPHSSTIYPLTTLPSQTCTTLTLSILHDVGLLALPLRASSNDTQCRYCSRSTPPVNINHGFSMFAHEFLLATSTQPSWTAPGQASPEHSVEYEMHVCWIEPTMYLSMRDAYVLGIGIPEANST